MQQGESNPSPAERTGRHSPESPIQDASMDLGSDIDREVNLGGKVELRNARQAEGEKRRGSV